MVRRGFEDAADRIQELYLAHRKDEAAAAVPDEWVDAKSLVGPPARIKQRYRAWEDSGATGADGPRPKQPEARRGDGRGGAPQPALIAPQSSSRPSMPEFLRTLGIISRSRRRPRRDRRPARPRRRGASPRRRAMRPKPAWMTRPVMSWASSLAR